MGPVMPGLVPGMTNWAPTKTWMAGTSPAMTMCSDLDVDAADAHMGYAGLQSGCRVTGLKR
jgi:hypothetical protein